MLISVSTSCEASATITLSQTMVFVTRRLELFVTFVVKRPCASSVTIYSACILLFVSLSYKISC